EAGRLPLQCPIPGCRHRWKAQLVAWALDEAQLQRYNNTVRGVRELRQRASASSGPPPPAGGAEPTSPRTAEALRQLGVRVCPQCASPIEKQGAGLGHGCDKMTCRCGCQFCYACGAVAGPGGAPRCKCVGDHHSYLPHSSVMNDYRDAPDRAGLFGGAFGHGGPFGGASPFGAPHFGAPLFGAPPFGAAPGGAPPGAAAAGSGGWPPEMQSLFAGFANQGGAAGPAGAGLPGFASQGGLGAFLRQAAQHAAAAAGPPPAPGRR
ncbi:unnamed protein product, partial [Prorocentrum cordatum]